MSILDGMLPPSKEPTRAELARREAQELALAQMYLLELAELAAMAAHEDDDEMVRPEENDRGSDGARFLLSVRDAYLAWVREHDGFPDLRQVGVGELVGDWVEQAPGSAVAHAFVDLGYYYGWYGSQALGADVGSLREVLHQASEQLVITLTRDYGPPV